MALVCWAVAVLALPGTAATAAPDEGEHVASFHLDAVIQPDGAIAVTEMIAYDFGTGRRPGIDRAIETRRRVDGRHDQVYELTDVTASSPSGAPDELRLIHDRSATTIRIGDAAVTVTGRHRYQLRYVLRGAMTSLSDRDELVWPATGTRWRVPVREVAVTVHAPGGLDQASCLVGRPASRTGCALTKRIDERQVTFRQPSLRAGEGLTVTVGLDKGVVTVAPPVLAGARGRRWDAPPSALSCLVAGLSVAGGTLSALLLWRRRDRRRDRNSATAALSPPAVPAGMRPALAGLLLAERVAAPQLGATIVDLATRGYLRIEQLPASDWRLSRLDVDGRADRLLAYESTLLAGLFHGGPQPRVSELDRRYRAWFVRASRQLAAEARRAGWFRRRPDLDGEVNGARRLGGGLPGSVLAAAGAGGGLLTVLVLTDAGWSAAVVASGLLLSWAVGRLVWHALPARTTLGRAVSAQVAGYRDHLAAVAAGRPTGETADAFGRDLPFAIAFGLTRHWTAFAEHKAAQPTIGWYQGDPASLGDAVDALTRATTPSPSHP